MEETEGHHVNKKCTTKTRSFKGRANTQKSHYQHPLLQYSSQFGFFNQNHFQSYSYYPAFLPLPHPMPLQLALAPPLSQNPTFQTKTHLQKLSCKVNDSALATSSVADAQVPVVTMTPAPEGLQGRTSLPFKGSNGRNIRSNTKEALVAARRPDSGGVEGHVITLLANHFLVKFNPSLKIYHYNVEISPKPSKEIARMIKQKLVENPGRPATRPVTLAQLLGRTTGRRGASLLVRETAARELEERRADWGYSKPVVALDMLWNTAFVAVSVVMLICTAKERPNTPIRLWICGYASQCLVHVVLVWLEYRRRNSSRTSARDEERGGAISGDANDSEDEEDGIGRSLSGSNESSVTKRCESLNTMASFLWWIVGFYWIVSGGNILLQNAPRLYWLSVVFLAFDVFFAIFCVVLACLIGIALCCCLPCIIAILYAVAEQEGASEADLSILPKYRFQIINNSEKGAGNMIPVETSSGYVANERILLPEDAECCICLSSYEDGVDLHALPCNHHFHSTCIVKWLKMNATCPLCKFDILKGNEHV